MRGGPKKTGRKQAGSSGEAGRRLGIIAANVRESVPWAAITNGQRFRQRKQLPMFRNNVVCRSVTICSRTEVRIAFRTERIRSRLITTMARKR